MSTERRVERVQSDSRFRADVPLPTGKVLTFYTKWEPSHWDHQPNNFVAVVRQSIHEIQRDYGFGDLSFRVFTESRRVAEVTETESGEKLRSEHEVAA